MKVNEIFGSTIQGEGRSTGMRTMFLRLSDCNLACIWCDTPQTWNWLGTKFKHPEKYNHRKEIHEVSCDEIIGVLKEKGPQIRSLVISGGEPMLQQGEIIELLRLLKKDGYWVEIETNGTIEPKDEFLELIDQINCSPKTSNSGPDNRPKMRERPKALQKLASSSKTFFKFVVSNESDLVEIKGLISKYNMKNVYLMAEGSTREEQVGLGKEVLQMCRENNFNFSPRLHVLYWDRARGV
ncbi:MAG: 7-carboxy-7-deazaguanine synthase QueE [Candidatus Taylorbacteria bacterium]|nr:7-carboxy-7-deazaguanine synthase QueE [Candidatus Taylorbacteria bacterium]